jgi:thiol:disulfide interchange protein
MLKPLFLALFTAMFFLLAYSMSHHGFFTGGPYNEPDRATQPYVP